MTTYEPGPTGDRPELATEVKRGLDFCRTGQWDKGLQILAAAAEADQRQGVLPGLVYSYLGYGLAFREHRVREGLKLCQHAIKIEFYQPENFVNLVRTELLANNRRGAVRALEQGLKVDPDNPELHEILRDLGSRRPPPLSFLSRDNLLNRVLGRLRHALTRPIGG
jgi:hypothetical protein